MKNIVLFGAGLNANVCIDIIEKQKEFNIVGIIDSKAVIGSDLYGYNIIGRQEDLLALVAKYKIASGLITIGDNYFRKYVKEVVLNLIPCFEFINAIHPNAIICRNVQLGIGTVIMPGVIINANCVIKDFCIVNTGARLEHDCYMGQFSHLSIGCITGGKVKIGDFSTVALGVTIIDRITIGENTFIGAGSLVLKDLPDNVLAYGSPAKIIRTIKVGERFLKSN